MSQRIAMVGATIVLNLRRGKGLKPFFFQNWILLNRALSRLTVSGNQVAVLMIKAWRPNGQLCCVANQPQSVDLWFVQQESLRGFAGKHHPPPPTKKLVLVDVSYRVPEISLTFNQS